MGDYHDDSHGKRPFTHEFENVFWFSTSSAAAILDIRNVLVDEVNLRVIERLDNPCFVHVAHESNTV